MIPPELATEIFEHILNKAINLRMVDPGTIFIDGTHIKASANKKKFQKEQVKKTAKIYEEQLREEVNAERAKLGKKPIEEDDDDEGGSTPGGTTEKTVSTTDPDCGMFVKGEHERQFAYEAHTACDSYGFVLGVEVTAGIRINVLICMGAGFFTLFPLLFESEQTFQVEAAIIQGVGFLCSGVIFKESASVRGMNTAAALWCTAAVGVLASSGMYLMAVTAAGILILSDLILRPLARKINPVIREEETEKRYRISVTCQYEAALVCLSPLR